MKSYATIFGAAFLPLVAIDRALCQTPCEAITLISPEPRAQDLFGQAIDTEGDTLVVGAPAEFNAFAPGAVYVLQFDGRTWIEKQKLVPFDSQPRDEFGCGVSLQGDCLMVGAPGNDALGLDSGAVYVFNYSAQNDNWVQTQKLVPNDAAPYSGFGGQVAMCGDTLAIGAEYFDTPLENIGAAYIYEYDGFSWVQKQTLGASDGEASDNFGKQLDLNGDVLVVASDLHEHDGDPRGGVYVFRRRADGLWIDEQELLVETPLSRTTVAVSGDLIAVGLKNSDNIHGNNAGAVFICEFDGESWVLQLELLAPDGATGDQFGQHLTFDDNILAINSHVGVYLYDYTRAGGSAWIRKLISSDDLAFGWALRLTRTYLFAGGNVPGNQPGAVYVFDVSTPNVDCNDNLVGDECEIAAGLATDCNGNGIPDECEGRGEDCDDNGVPDECDPDCNANGVPDTCDIANGDLLDCNDNLIPDDCDIADGFSDDFNDNGVPDECDLSRGDLNLDGVVDGGDLLILLGSWGTCPKPPFDCPADLDLDDTVGPSDLIILLGNWG